MRLHEEKGWLSHSLSEDENLEQLMSSLVGFVSNLGKGVRT